MNKIREIDPPAGFEAVIMQRIHTAEKKRAIMRCSFAGFMTVASVAGIIPAVSYVIQSVQSSGFSEYLSLIFSDSGSLLSFWKEFSLSIVESLPFFGLTIALVLLGIFIWSAAKTAENARAALTA